VVPRSQPDLLQRECNGRNFPSRSTLIITNPALEAIGRVDIVKRCIPPETPVRVTIIPDAEPDIKIVKQGVEALNFYKADQIIALGGGSVIDAAKITKLQYEFPDADLEELAAPFLDIRKRVVQYPTEKTNHARLIAVSTTSGTGSEVTPFAVMTDKERGFKGHAGRLFANAGRRDCRSAVCDVDAEGPDGRYRC
jgi:acetaldehyde dehydrogenase/alcohol dehydrogenase